MYSVFWDSGGGMVQGEQTRHPEGPQLFLFSEVKWE